MIRPLFTVLLLTSFQSGLKFRDLGFQFLNTVSTRVVSMLPLLGDVIFFLNHKNIKAVLSPQRNTVFCEQDDIE